MTVHNFPYLSQTAISDMFSSNRNFKGNVQTIFFLYVQWEECFLFSRSTFLRMTLYITLATTSSQIGIPWWHVWTTTNYMRYVPLASWASFRCFCLWYIFVVDCFSLANVYSKGEWCGTAVMNQAKAAFHQVFILMQNRFRLACWTFYSQIC